MTCLRLMLVIGLGVSGCTPMDPPIVSVIPEGEQEGSGGVEANPGGAGSPDSGEQVTDAGEVAEDVSSGNDPQSSSTGSEELPPAMTSPPSSNGDIPSMSDMGTTEGASGTPNTSGEIAPQSNGGSEEQPPAMTSSPGSDADIPSMGDMGDIGDIGDNPQSGMCGDRTGFFCEGALLQHCEANADPTMQEVCDSADLCEAGVSTGSCASCLDGAAFCDDDKVMICLNHEFSIKETCKSGTRCSQSEQTCVETPCDPGLAYCEGNTLRQCSAEGDPLPGGENCSLGCDLFSSSCRVCSPLEKRCDGKVLRTCNGLGTEEASTECSAFCQDRACFNIGSCSSVSETICGVFGGTCENQVSTSGDRYDLCRWALLGTETLCLSSVGIWTTSSSTFAKNSPASVPPGAAGACITQVSNLSCSAADVGLCRQHGATCDRQFSTSGERHDVCRWAAATTEARCTSTDGIWTAVDSAFARGWPRVVPLGAPGACVTQTANLR